jgi:hypothetical protein
MDRGMLALVLSAVLLGLVLIVYFILLKPVAAPVPVAGAAGKLHRRSEAAPAVSIKNAPQLNAALPAKAEMPQVEAAQVAEMEVRKNAETDTPARSTPRRVVPPALGTSAENEEVHIDFIIASVVSSPRYTLVDGPDKPFRPGSWLQIEVDFTTFPGVIRELTLRYSIALRGETFVGAIKHVDIAQGPHRSVAYLVPRRTERFLVNGKLPERVLESVTITAYIRDRLVARSGIGTLSSANREPVEGFIRSLEQTPFLPLDAGRFEPVAPLAPAKEKEKRAPQPEGAPRFTQTLTSRE